MKLNRLLLNQLKQYKCDFWPLTLSRARRAYIPLCTGGYGGQVEWVRPLRLNRSFCLLRYFFLTSFEKNSGQAATFYTKASISKKSRFSEFQKKSNEHRIYLLFFLLMCGYSTTLFPFFSSPHIAYINSTNQTLLPSGVNVFQGDVEVIIDTTLRLWADTVTINQKQRSLVAQRTSPSPITIQTDDFTLLAHDFQCNIKKKTGVARNVRLHIPEGYLFATSAEKMSDNRWCMKDIEFTPCDKDSPDWVITAEKAYIDTGYFIKISAPCFKIGGFPVFFLPYLLIPLQGRSRSGFLIPQIYLDYDKGFGFKQEYYYHITDRCDTTFGIDWCDQKGFMLFDEFRWGQAPDSYSYIKSYYAASRDMLGIHNNVITPQTKRKYWIQGYDFRPLPLIEQADTRSLVRVDCGSDKVIGYRFFGDPEQIDDTFYNTLLIRFSLPFHLVNCGIENMSTGRRFFSHATNIPNTEPRKGFLKQKQQPILHKRELCTNYTVWQAPFVSWSTTYYEWGDFLWYRHDLFCNHLYFREFEEESSYRNNLLINRHIRRTYQTTNLLRADYYGTLQASYNLAGHVLTAEFQPHAQLRSKILKPRYLKKNVYEKKLFAQGALRLVPSYRVEWAMPGITPSFIEGSCILLQPLVTWDYTPCFRQKHWFQIDEHDTIYPQNELAATFRGCGIVSDIHWQLDVCQGYDFFPSHDIFPLRRGFTHHNLLPTRITGGITTPRTELYCQSEYDLCAGKLATTYLSYGVRYEALRIGIDYIYQNKIIQKKRKLLADSQHIIGLDFSISLETNVELVYRGQHSLVSQENGKHSYKPLLQSIQLQYAGHCWGCVLGYEEKRYRDFGYNKCERALFFSLRFDSLGSFAKKFKNPEFLETLSPLQAD